MCGMFFTFNKDNIPLLSEMNAKRGGINETLTTVKINGDDLYVGHFQAPTSIDSGTQPHEIRLGPIVDMYTNLWHNGILKESQINELIEKYSNEDLYKLVMKKVWDTSLLHYALLDEYDLSEIDGSFALFLHTGFKSDSNKGELYFARNALAPLFINEDTKEVSSVKIPQLGITKSLPHGEWFNLVSKDSILSQIKDNIFKNFTTKNNPYDI